jgi:ABC-type enterochelin transport system substrate-binding protein
VQRWTTALVRLEPKSVATFYHETMDALKKLGIEVKIWKMPVEIPDPIPFRSG